MWYTAIETGAPPRTHYIFPDGEMTRERPLISLGIDPGLLNCGVGKVMFRPDKKSLHLLQAVMIETNPKLTDQSRLRHIRNCIYTVLDPQVDFVGIEKFFVHGFRDKGGKLLFGDNAQKMNQVIGVCLEVCADVEIIQFTPTDIKLGIANNGRADKPEVQEAVKRILRLDDILRPDHVSDGTAAAILRLIVSPQYRASSCMAHMPIFGGW